MILFSLRHRTLNLLCLLGMFMSFSAGIVNYLLGLGTLAVILNVGCGVVTMVLYYLSLVHRQYELPALVCTVMLSFVFFPAMWLINAGTNGSIPYYFIINAGIISLLLTGKKRTAIFSLFLAVVAILIAVENYRPQLVTGYSSAQIRYLDLSFGFIVCLLVNAFLFAVLMDSYLHEKKITEHYNKTLAEKNREIEAKNKILENRNAELKKAIEKAENLSRLLYKEKEKLYEASITDHLTNVYNKMFITKRLKEEFELTRNTQGGKLTVALIDIDNFKNINDLYGHVYGDYVIKRIAETIKKNLRQQDIVGRFGGDEFLIVLPNTGWEEGCNVIERIRKVTWELEWKDGLKVSISGGVAELKNEQLSYLLKEVDELLYKAKNKGKNRIEIELA